MDKLEVSSDGTFGQDVCTVDPNNVRDSMALPPLEALYLPPPADTRQIQSSATVPPKSTKKKKGRRNEEGEAHAYVAKPVVASGRDVFIIDRISRLQGEQSTYQRVAQHNSFCQRLLRNIT
jgi:hypothetical protein